MNHPEDNLQTKINQWQREHVPQPHVFFSVDRRAKTGAFSHAREKSRGMRKGTGDTWLLYPGLPAICVELKARGKKVAEGDSQEVFGADVKAAGHLWAWCDTVIGYAEILIGFGVPLQGNWRWAAEHKDGVLLAAAIRAEESRTGKPSRARSAYPTRPSKAALARGARMAAVRP